MAAAPVPPPQPMQPASPGPASGGSQIISPAAAVEDQGANVLLRGIMNIIATARMVAQKIPQTAPEVRDINDAVQRMMAKIKGNQAPTEAQAPPL